MRRWLGRTPRRAWCWDESQRRWASSIVTQYADEVGKEASRLQELMEDGVSLDDDRRLKKRWRAVERIFERGLEYNTLWKEAVDLEAMLNDSDAEMAEMAKTEYADVAAKLDVIRKEFDRNAVLDEDEGGLEVILEVQGGAGGAEGDLFAEELFDAYRALAREHGWRFDVKSSDEDDPNFISEENRERVFSARVTGDDAFRMLKWESGVHRVQRVPATESGGRVHTSTAGVKVLPCFDEETLQEFPRSDFSFSSGRSTGPGGQGVNSINTKATVKHIPTGLVVESQETRVLQHNQQTAWEKICALLWEMQKQKELEEQGEKRASLAFSLDRHNKIRTYNWDRSTVTDHRLPKADGVVMLDEFFGQSSGLTHLIEQLIALDTANRKSAWFEDRVEYFKGINVEAKKA